MASTTQRLSGKQAAIEILRASGGTMKVSELTKQAAARATDMKGKTPEATIAAAIYTSAKKGQTFRVVSRGEVALVDPASTPEPVEVLTDDESAAVTPGSVVIKRGTKVTANPGGKSDADLAAKRAAKAAKERERRAAKKAAASA